LNEVGRAAELVDGRRKLNDIRSAISLVARYDIQAAMMSKEEATEHLRKFVRKTYPSSTPGFYEKHIAYYIDHATEYPLLKMDHVPITDAELDVVKAQNGIRAQCFAFALLAVAKFDTMRFPDVNYWVNGDRWSEVIHRANLTLSEDDVCHILHVMYIDGLVDCSPRVDNCSIHVLYPREGSTILELRDQDFCDLGYTYRAYIGEPYTRCEECGKWIKQARNGRTRFCKDCSASNHRAQNSARMRRIRA